MIGKRMVVAAKSTRPFKERRKRKEMLVVSRAFAILSSNGRSCAGTTAGWTCRSSSSTPRLRCHHQRLHRQRLHHEGRSVSQIHSTNHLLQDEEEECLPRRIVARPRALPIPRPFIAFGPIRLNMGACCSISGTMMNRSMLPLM